MDLALVTGKILQPPGHPTPKSAVLGVPPPAIRPATTASPSPIARMSEAKVVPITAAGCTRNSVDGTEYQRPGATGDGGARRRKTSTFASGALTLATLS